MNSAFETIFISIDMDVIPIKTYVCDDLFHGSFYVWFIGFGITSTDLIHIISLALIGF